MKEHKNLKNIIGNKYGRLTVLEKSIERGNRNQIKYKCICECGSIHTVTGESIRSGKSKSCGCIQKIPPNYEPDRKKAIYKNLYKSMKDRSIKKGIKTNISLNEFIEISKQPCYYCGLKNSNYANDLAVKKWNDKIKNERGNEIVYYNGIDRIDSSIGYLKNNIVSCCKYCNIAKNVMSQIEFKEFIKRVYDYYVKR